MNLGSLADLYNRVYVYNSKVFRKFNKAADDLGKFMGLNGKYEFWDEQTNHPRKLLKEFKNKLKKINREKS